MVGEVWRVRRRVINWGRLLGGVQLHRASCKSGCVEPGMPRAESRLALVQAVGQCASLEELDVSCNTFLLKATQNKNEQVHAHV